MKKQITASVQRNGRALAGRGAGNSSHLVGVLLLSLLLFNVPVARGQSTQYQYMLLTGLTVNTVPSPHVPFAYLDPFGAGFKIRNAWVGSQFATWAAAPGVQVLIGNFRTPRPTSYLPGLSDIALVGIPGIDFVPIWESNGDGTFTVTNLHVGDFARWAAVPGVRALVGDFNGDGRADIALVGGGGLVHRAGCVFKRQRLHGHKPPCRRFRTLGGRSRGAGSGRGFQRGWPSRHCTRGGAGWWTVPVAFSNGDGTFKITNDTVTNSSRGDFAGWATTPGVQVLVADFNGDGKSDIALVGDGMVDPADCILEW
jgi:hypothetical protein